jgi:hypothetical protein
MSTKASAAVKSRPFARMKENQWIHNARFTSWWLDFADLGWPDPNLTAKWRRRAEAFQKQGVNAVVMFGFHFRWDYIPVMQRVLGALREIAEICHEHELKVVEHHSATLVHRVRSEQDRREIRERNNHHVPFYPDTWENVRYKGRDVAQWRQISARDGKPVYFERYTCECFCPNNTDYQRAYLDYIRDHLEAVPVDAMMSDDLHFLPDVYSCACEHCRKRFGEEEGHMLPPVTDKSFWENQEDERYQAWLQARYRWNADHYKRLRAILPKNVMLWGCASNCIEPRLGQMGFSPQHFAPHFDAVFHEIFHKNQPGTHDVEIASDLAGFASLARHYRKPLVALCYLDRPEDLGAWLHLLTQHHARPWISKQVRIEDATPEEQLLSGGFHFPRDRKKSAHSALHAIVFSESHRDKLPADRARDYTDLYRQLCLDILSKGDEVHVLFDSLWEKARPETWDCLWIPDADALTPQQEEKMQEWQSAGLALSFP